MKQRIIFDILQKESLIIFYPSFLIANISVIDECVSDPCSNGATCVDIERGFRCACPAGFTGPDCDIDINECFGNNVCLNNATCVDMVNDYKCHCQEGFKGNNCEINIDDCDDGKYVICRTCLRKIGWTMLIL